MYTRSCYPNPRSEYYCTETIRYHKVAPGTVTAMQETQPGLTRNHRGGHENSLQSDCQRDADCARHPDAAEATRMSAPVLTARLSCAMALLFGLSGCAGVRFSGTPDHSTVPPSRAARECRIAAASSVIPPKLERTARAAVGGATGALFGAVGGAATSFIFAALIAPACVEPTSCAAGVGAIITIGAVAGGVAGAVEGARTAWRESSGVPRSSDACTTEAEIRSSGSSSSGKAELPHRRSQYVTRFVPFAQTRIAS